jgi:hypothetical protein
MYITSFRIDAYITILIAFVYLGSGLFRFFKDMGSARAIKIQNFTRSALIGLLIILALDGIRIIGLW